MFTGGGGIFTQQQQNPQGLMGGQTTNLFGQPMQQQQQLPMMGGTLFGGQQQPMQMQQQLPGQNLFNTLQPIGGTQNIFGGGMMQQQQQPQQNTYYGGQMQTLQTAQPGQIGLNDWRHDQEVEVMLKLHNQTLNFQKEFAMILGKMQSTVKDANQNLVKEAQKLSEGKPVMTAKTTTSLGGQNGNTVVAQTQFVEKKGINKESIEQTSASLAKVREKNEVIFAKLLEIHCLIERVSSNANAIDRDSNAEMRVFRTFNDIDSKIHSQNQKLIDLNHKFIDSKNIQESLSANSTFGAATNASSSVSSARDHNGSLNSAAVVKRKQALIEMLAQMKKGIEIVKEQHQEDAKDFEILVKKLNASRTLPF